MAADTPHPMPTSMRDEVLAACMGSELKTLDNEGRFVLRRLVADAYAKGFQDGRIDEQVNQSFDNTTMEDRP